MSKQDHHSKLCPHPTYIKGIQRSYKQLHMRCISAQLRFPSLLGGSQEISLNDNGSPGNRVQSPYREGTLWRVHSIALRSTCLPPQVTPLKSPGFSPSLSRQTRHAHFLMKASRSEVEYFFQTEIYRCFQLQCLKHALLNPSKLLLHMAKIQCKSALPFKIL